MAKKPSFVPVLKPTATMSTPETMARPFEINGFENEIRETMRCARAGEIESPVVPHAETLAVLGWMDRIRALAGVKSPFDDAFPPSA